MKVNQNTINADVRFWYSQLGKFFDKKEVKGCVAKQLVRYENQTSRLTEKLELCTHDTETQLNIERVIADINGKAANLYLKILASHAQDDTDSKLQQSGTGDIVSIDEETVRHITLFLTLKYAKNPKLDETTLRAEIINMEHCTEDTADSICHYMQYDLGLHYCRDTITSLNKYDLLEFVLLRRYVNLDDTYTQNLYALCMQYNIQPFQKSEMLKKFTDKHGDKKDCWDNATHEDYSQESETLKNSHAETSSRIFTQAFEGIQFDENKFDQYTQYIATEFANTDSKIQSQNQLLERIFDD